MRLEEVERFVLVPYAEDSFDCADLVMLVQRELFGREVSVPGRRLAVRVALPSCTPSLARTHGGGYARRWMGTWC